ncbi:MAG: hypothetical protein C0506_04460 [Anaerolinea sp.]|nr:hypothetical protein [Anaerolinea sp.]
MAAKNSRLLPVAAAAIGLATILGVVFLAWYLNRDTLPAPPATFQPPPPTVPYYTYNVKDAGQDGLVLSGKAGSADIRIARPATVEVMAPGTPSQLQPGDWVNVIGIIDEVRNFSIRTLVAIPEHGPPGPDGAGRSTAGFSGIEVRADPAERVIQGGEVIRIQGNQVTLAGPSGELVLTVSARAPLFRITAAEPAAITSGDRLVVGEALAAGAKPPAVLAGKLTPAVP